MNPFEQETAVSVLHCCPKSSLHLLLVGALTLFCLLGCSTKDWRTASREPAGLAPDPAHTKEAVLQIYGATTWGWRGWFAIHTWFAAKPPMTHLTPSMK